MADKIVVFEFLEGAGQDAAPAAGTPTLSYHLIPLDYFNTQLATKITAPLTGDVTSSASVTTIANDVVTNAKSANMATQTLKGRTTAGTGDPEDLSAPQATAILNTMVGDSGSGGTKGLVPAPSIGDAAALKFLKADGTWAAPSGGGGGSGFAGFSTVKTSNYTVISGDSGKCILVDTTAGSFTVTLPTPVAGFSVDIKDATGFCGRNQLTIARNGSESIDNGAASDAMPETFQAVNYSSDGTNWYRRAKYSGQSVAGRALFGGGKTATTLVIDYVSISTLSNATSFGNLTAARGDLAAFASSTRGVFAGGLDGGYSAAIDYVTILSAGNATSFGNLSTTIGYLAGLSSATRGVTGGGINGSSAVIAVMDYVTIATTGNSTSFGNLTAARYTAGGCASTTRGVFGGGANGNSAVIDYITIASTGNATSFGNLTVGREQCTGALSNSTRGCWGGGNVAAGTGINNTIDYVTIASTGNATDFGDLSVNRYGTAGAANATRGLYGGGFTGSNSNVIDYIAIASTGNATDFGDLTLARSAAGGLSNSHGGL